MLSHGGESAHALPPAPYLPAAADPLIVCFQDVGKSFRRFEFQPFLLRNLARRLTGRAVAPREFWPIRHISFDIRSGETVGVIGQNGSGKSTLLRLIAGACYPTEGCVSVRGRIAPLLALGAGFHPDMTGRECVEVNGTALGLSRQEIRERMDDILGFAEIGDFLDMPVRYYSSGMKVRLAFSIATAIDPEILLVDEVLSVGDRAFQEKAGQRMRDMMSKARLIVFVSHDLASIKKLCHRAIWLDHGRVRMVGDPADVAEAYTESATVKPSVAA